MLPTKYSRSCWLTLLLLALCYPLHDDLFSIHQAGYINPAGQDQGGYMNQNQQQQGGYINQQQGTVTFTSADFQQQQ
jgi:hypothetical protein